MEITNYNNVFNIISLKFKKEEIENFEKNKTSEKFMNQYFHEEYKSFQRKELSSISLGWIYYGALNYLSDLTKKQKVNLKAICAFR